MMLQFNLFIQMIRDDQVNSLKEQLIPNIFYSMTTNTTTLKQFQIISKIGDGSFAQVFKVRRLQDGQYYAMKKIRLTKIKQKDKNNALNEVRLLASEKGQNVIQFKQAFFDESTFTLCIVMEYAQKGDLLKLIQSHIKTRTYVPQSEIWKALVHVTKGLKSLHEKKILHRDLKGANIFINAEGIYKLGDLNVSKVIKHDLAKTQTGTPYYASPEVWKDQPYGTKSDMWSLGCVLYQLAAQKPPFTATDIHTLYKKIMKGTYQRIPSQYSNDLAGVISTLLKLDPNERPSSSSLLNNPIVQQHYCDQTVSNICRIDDELLSTIKFQSRNFKMINNVLPKAKYTRNSSESNQRTIIDSFFKGNGEKSILNRGKDRVKSLYQSQVNDIKYTPFDNTSNLLKRQRIVSNYEPLNNIGETSTIDQIDIFKNLPLTQKQTKKELEAISIKQGNMTKKETKNRLIARGSHHKMENLISRFLLQDTQVRNKQNLRNVGQQIMNLANKQLITGL